jgi:hypothetical protein
VSLPVHESRGSRGTVRGRGLSPYSRFDGWDGLIVLALIALAVVALWRLALTNLIIGRGDLFFYFYPYRDYASEAVRSGRVPLWNPYSFMGAPFLANSQAGFFYPLNLVLAWLPVQQMVNASLLLHAVLAASGAYLWGRSGLGLGRPAAWITALCYGLGGYFLAQVEHLNQFQVLAWLPWLLWVYTWSPPRMEAADAARAWTIVQIWVLGVIIALQALVGHIQSLFICVVGLAAYAVLPVAWEVLRRQSAWRALLRPLGVLLGAALLGGALAAVQLLPTLELSRLSVRSGGLPYREAVSFSLRPELFGRALLPSWGPPLFPEFVAYVGVLALGLALLGVWADWSGSRGGATAAPPPGRERLARRGALSLALLGLFLALGGFNPVYYLLVKLVPGFGFFRAPARWLALYAVGVAGLAGVGLETIWTGRISHRQRLLVAWAGFAGVLVAWALVGRFFLGEQDRDLVPALSLESAVWWIVAVIAFGAVIYFGAESRGRRTARHLALLLALLLAVELLGASVFLPYNRATAPEALTSLRPAVTHLVGEALSTPEPPPARFLSISDIFFDPGDKTEIEIMLSPQLSDDAVYDYIIATKQKEVLIPNLPLYYRLPAMDGYDGGVLPLRRYVTLERLYMPPEQIAIDGRLRENLEGVPDGRWLSAFNVRYVITDKVRDAWFGDVFYDLQMGAVVEAGEKVAVGYVPEFPATALGIVYQADGAPEGTPLADVDVTFSDGRTESLALEADASGSGDRVARLSWGHASAPSAINVRGAPQSASVKIRGMSLVDERTGTFMPLVLSDTGHYRLVHSGDVKIYENLDALPRMFFVPRAIPVPDEEAALAVMRAPSFDPAANVVLEVDNSRALDWTAARDGTADAGDAAIEVLLYEPERVTATVTAPAGGWLVLSDAWYPGWEATVDGEPVQVERANVLFRAIAVPAGSHRVEWTYRPASFRLGTAISLGALGVLAVGLVWFGLGRQALAGARAVLLGRRGD